MFDTVTISANHTNAGNIADALIYYGRTNIVVNTGQLVTLVRTFGGDNLLRAVDSGFLEINFQREHIVVASSSGPLSTHSFGFVRHTGTAEGKRITSTSDDIQTAFARNFGQSKETRALAQSLSGRLKSKRRRRNDVLEAARQNALNPVLMREGVANCLAVIAPEYMVPADLDIRVTNVSGHISFLSNLDFEQINQSYQRRISSTDRFITPAFLLATLLTATNETILSAEAGSELWMAPFEAAFLQAKIANIVNAASNFQQKIQLFHDVKFKGRTFHGAIETGERNACELLDLLEMDKTRKFKSWLAEQSPEANLVDEYYHAVLKDVGWTQRLPFKVGKLTIFSGLGIMADLTLGTMGMATASTTAVSFATDMIFGASDELLISKLKGGWKPNQFVDGPGTDFLKLEETKS